MTDETEKMLVIPKGALLTITTGSYSDYYVKGVFRATDEIDADALCAEYLGKNPDRKGKYHCFEDDKFLGWVARKGLLEAIESFEWHLGEYSYSANEMEMSVEHDAGFKFQNPGE